MNARELIEQEMGKPPGAAMRTDDYARDYIPAAERVVERLQNRVDELMVSAHPIQTVQSERERYRDRLDRMVAGLMANPTGFDAGEAAKIAVGFLAAIDAEVDKEERR